MKVYVESPKDGSSIYLGEFKSIKEAKEYWTQEDVLLKKMVRNKVVKFIKED